MKRGLAAFLIVFSVFAAPRVMTNQTLEAMVYGGVPLPTIVAAIKSAARIQLSETKLDYDRLIAAGSSPAAATEIMKAVHYRQFVGIDNHPVKMVAPPIQTTPTATPKALEVSSDVKSQPQRVAPTVPGPGSPPAAALVPSVPVPVTTGQLKPETAVSMTARTQSAVRQDEDAVTVDEVGVYYDSGKGWTAIRPETVSWKTGGVLKLLGTLGVVKGDVNGELRYGSSKTHLGANVQLLVFAPEGVAVEEYQLIKLHARSDSREFRGGSDRDTVDFEGVHVAPRTWTINLGSLPRGEYGLLPPRMSDERSAGAQLDKMYTFSTSD